LLSRSSAFVSSVTKSALRSVRSSFESTSFGLLVPRVCDRCAFDILASRNAIHQRGVQALVDRAGDGQVVHVADEEDGERAPRRELLETRRGRLLNEQTPAFFSRATIYKFDCRESSRSTFDAAVAGCTSGMTLGGLTLYHSTRSAGVMQSAAARSLNV
jgi:hypothetical protein